MSLSRQQPEPTNGSFAVRLGMFYGALFLLAGIKLPFLPVWLDWRGLSASEIAMVTAMPLIVRVLATPFVAIAADMLGNRRRTVVLMSWMALAAVLVLGQASGYAAILIAALLIAFASTGIMPLTETIAMSGVRRLGVDYGRMRLWGSITFIAAAFAGGAALDVWGAGSVIVLIAVSAVLVALGAHALPVTSDDHPEKPGARPSLGDLLRLAMSWRMALFLIAAGSVQAAHAVFYTFGVLHWRSSGLSSGWSGALWSIGVIAEISVFAASTRLVALVGASGLLLAGAAAAVARWCAMAFDPPLAALVPLQALHGLTFGAAHLGAVHYIARAVPPALAGTGQALYSTVASGIAMGAATIVAGPLYAAYSGGAYLAMAVVAGAGLVAALLLVRLPDDGHPSATRANP